MAITNTTGYAALLDGKYFTAIYEAYNLAFGGFFIAVIFFAIQILLFLKTKDALLPFIIGMFFTGLYHAGSLALGGTNPIALNIMYTTLVLQFAGIMFSWIWKAIKGGF